jgi:hypothetical protein
VGVQPEQHMWDPRHDETSGWWKSSHDPRGSLAGMPRSHARGEPLLLPFQASTNTHKNTTMERRNIVTQHGVSGRATQLCSAQSSSRGVLPGVTTQDAEEGGKKRCK